MGGKELRGGVIFHSGGVEKDFGRALSIGQREEFCVSH